jgi:hypothetical protein
MTDVWEGTVVREDWAATVEREVWSSNDYPGTTFVTTVVDPDQSSGSSGLPTPIGDDGQALMVRSGTAAWDTIEIDDVDGLRAILDAAGATGFLRVAYLVDKPVNAAGVFLPMSLPACLPVVLNAQVTGAQDGIYLSNGAGGVTGSPTPVKTLDNAMARLVVMAQVALTDVYNSAAGAIYDPNSRPGNQNLVDVRMVTAGPGPGGLVVSLSPQGLPGQALLDLSGKAYTPMMNDFGGVNTNLQLTVNHQIVSCNPSGPITITLAPHATKPRPVFISVDPSAAGSVTLVEYPGELDFSRTLQPGDRVLILPDQAAWTVWPFPNWDGLTPALRVSFDPGATGLPTNVQQAMIAIYASIPFTGDFITTDDATDLIDAQGVALTIVDEGLQAQIDTTIKVGTGAGGALSGTYPSPGLNVEAVQDLVAGFLAAGQGVEITYDDSGGILTIAVTALAITSSTVVASEAAMLALTAQEGDVAIRSDTNTNWILGPGPSATLSSWRQLLTPTDAVLSVAGKTGVVTLAKADVGLGSVDNTPDAGKPVSTATQTALDLKVSSSLYDANTILAATSDNTPVALTIPEQTLVGRKTGGNIVALTAAEVLTLLGVSPSPWSVVGESTLSVDSLSVNIPISGTCDFLDFHWIAQSDYTSGANNNVTCQFNSDTASNYLNASSASSSFTLCAIASSQTNTNRRGHGQCRISNQAAYHNLDSRYWYQNSNAATTSGGNLGGAWQSTSRITSIQLALGGSIKFVAGSHFVVFGRT